MKLLRLELENFKGVRSFVLDAQGRNVSVYGDNATGKTTLADAFCWLLFDKDSQNRADFGIKTIGPDGKPVHNLDHSVGATLELEGGGVVKLRKVYREVWTKKRGAARAIFSGHTTDYYVDGVPVQAKEYKERVAGIANEGIFRLLTDPLHFNLNLHWQERRRILLDVCGDVTDAEVIASEHALARLPGILGGRSLDDHRKVITARRREINQELDRIPVRIDEARRALPKLPEGKDRAAIEAEMAQLKAERQQLEQERARIEAGGEIAEKRRRISEIETEMLDIRRDLRAAADKQAQSKRAELAGIRKQMGEAKAEIDRLNAEHQRGEETINRLEERMNALRSEWYRVNDEPFVHDHTENCPTCGQALPAEQIEATRRKALEVFNEAKARRLTEINDEGRRLKSTVEAIMTEAVTRRESIIQRTANLNELERRAQALELEIDALEQSAPDPNDDPDYLKLAQEKAELEAAIRQLQENRAGALAELKRKTDAIDDRLYFLGIDLTTFTQRDTGLARIAELEAQQRTLAAEFERLEEELGLCEEFVRAKVRLLEERINSRFHLARFKLFDQQVNGGIAECCETTYNGVPFRDLNHGAQLNVGLDIINTLAAHYGFAPPVWVDNAESVTSILPTRGQQIRLVVSAADKELRVEVEAAQREAALV